MQITAATPISAASPGSMPGGNESWALVANPCRGLGQTGQTGGADQLEHGRPVHRFSGNETAGALRLDHLHPQTQEFTIP